MSFEKYFYSGLVNAKNTDIKSSADIKDLIFYSRKYMIGGHILESTNSESKDLADELLKLKKIFCIKYLSMTQDLKSIREKFLKNGIRHVLLKGAALQIKGFYSLGERQFRDLDILVDKKDLKKAYDVLKSLGFYYSNKYSNDRCDFLGNMHHIPPMVNQKLTNIDLHHRVTLKKHFRECPLTNYCLNNIDEINETSCPDNIFLISHAFYHGLIHHYDKPVPTLTYDLFKLFSSDMDSWQKSKSIVNKLGLGQKFNEISSIFSSLKNLNRLDDKTINRLKEFQEIKWTYSRGQVLFFSRNNKKRTAFNWKFISQYFEDLRYRYQTSLVTFKLPVILMHELINNRHRIKFWG